MLRLINILSSHFFRYRFPAFVWALIIFLASSIQSVRLPKIDFISVDKVVHIFVFFVFGILMYRAFEPKETGSIQSWKRFVFSCLITISYGISDEVHQSFVPGRHLDKFDMLADAIGATLAVGLMLYFVRKRNKQRFRQV